MFRPSHNPLFKLPLYRLYQLIMPECYDTHPWSLYTTIKRLNDVGKVKFLLEHLSWEHIINLFWNKCACQIVQGDDDDADENHHGFFKLTSSTYWQNDLDSLQSHYSHRPSYLISSQLVGEMMPNVFLTTINKSEHEMAQVLRSREIVRSNNWLTFFYSGDCCQHEVIVTLSISQRVKCTAINYVVASDVGSDLEWMLIVEN